MKYGLTWRNIQEQRINKIAGASILFVVCESHLIFCSIFMKAFISFSRKFLWFYFKSCGAATIASQLHSPQWIAELFVFI